MADRQALDMIDFFNVQFYNQIPFPTPDCIFDKGGYLGVLQTEFGGQKMGSEGSRLAESGRVFGFG